MEKKIILEIKDHKVAVVVVRYPDEVFEHWTRSRHTPTRASVKRVDNLMVRLGIDYVTRNEDTIFMVSNVIQVEE